MEQHPDNRGSTSSTSFSSKTTNEGPIKENLRSMGREAADQASHFADGKREIVSDSLGNFAQAIKRASEELSSQDQTMAAQIVQQAAGGLESLSSSISRASVPEMIDSLREFGRRNPVVFFGGAVLTGLVLGRLARASGTQTLADPPGQGATERSMRSVGERAL